MSYHGAEIAYVKNLLCLFYVSTVVNVDKVAQLVCQVEQIIVEKSNSARILINEQKRFLLFIFFFAFEETFEFSHIRIVPKLHIFFTFINRKDFRKYLITLSVCDKRFARFLLNSLPIDTHLVPQKAFQHL